MSLSVALHMTSRPEDQAHDRVGKGYPTVVFYEPPYGGGVIIKQVKGKGHDVYQQAAAGEFVVTPQGIAKIEKVDREDIITYKLLSKNASDEILDYITKRHPWLNGFMKGNWSSLPERVFSDRDAEREGDFEGDQLNLLKNSHSFKYQQLGRAAKSPPTPDIADPSTAMLKLSSLGDPDKLHAGGPLVMRLAFSFKDHGPVVNQIISRPFPHQHVQAGDIVVEPEFIFQVTKVNRNDKIDLIELKDSKELRKQITTRYPWFEYYITGHGLAGREAYAESEEQRKGITFADASQTSTYMVSPLHLMEALDSTVIALSNDHFYAGSYSSTTRSPEQPLELQLIAGDKLVELPRDLNFAFMHIPHVVFGKSPPPTINANEYTSYPLRILAPLPEHQFRYSALIDLSPTLRSRDKVRKATQVIDMAMLLLPPNGVDKLSNCEVIRDAYFAANQRGTGHWSNYPKHFGGTFGNRMTPMDEAQFHSVVAAERATNIAPDHFGAFMTLNLGHTLLVSYINYMSVSPFPVDTDYDEEKTEQTLHLLADEKELLPHAYELSVLIRKCFTMLLPGAGIGAIKTACDDLIETIKTHTVIGIKDKTPEEVQKSGALIEEMRKMLRVIDTYFRSFTPSIEAFVACSRVKEVEVIMEVLNNANHWIPVGVSEFPYHSMGMGGFNPSRR